MEHLSDSVLYIVITMFLHLVAQAAKLQHGDELCLVPTESIFIYKVSYSQ